MLGTQIFNSKVGSISRQFGVSFSIEDFSKDFDQTLSHMFEMIDSVIDS